MKHCIAGAAGACISLVMLGAAQTTAAAYYEADARASSYLGPTVSTSDISTGHGVAASAASAANGSGYSEAIAGPGYLGAYAHTAAAGALTFAEARSTGYFVLSDLVFSSGNPSLTEIPATFNFALSGILWGAANPGSNMHSRGGISFDWRLTSGGVTYFDAAGSVGYWSYPDNPGYALVNAGGLLHDPNSPSPAATVFVPGAINSFSVDFLLNPGLTYELTGWVSADAASGFAAANDGNTELGFDFSHTLSFPTSGPVFGLPGGVTVNSLDGAIVNNEWIDPRSSVVPLPAAVWLFGSGLIALLGITRRRQLRG